MPQEHATQGPQQVALRHDARPAVEARGEDDGVRAQLVHEARDEGPVARDRVERTRQGETETPPISGSSYGYSVGGRVDSG